MSSKEYQLISEEDASDDDAFSQTPYRRRGFRARFLLAGIVPFVLILSLPANVLWLIHYIGRVADGACDGRTAYGNPQWSET